MARTIGVKYKNQIKRIVAASSDHESRGTIMDKVQAQLPLLAWDSWEGAYNEIDRLVDDLVWARVFSPRKD